MMFRALRSLKERPPIVCGLAAALLLIGTTPSFGVPYLSFVALVPLVLLAHLERSGGHIFWTAFAAGTAYGIVMLLPLMSLEGWWFAVSDTFYTWRLYFWGAGLLAFAVALSGLLFGIFFRLYALLPRHRAVLHGVLFAALWGVLEYAREQLAFDFSWGHLGYALHHSSALVQLASPAGVYGLSALIVFVNILIAHGLIRFVHQQRQHGRAVPALLHILRSRVALTLIAVCGVVFMYGHDAYRAQISERSGTPLSVAVLNTRFSAEEGRGDEGFTRYRELLAEAARADIVVAPESIFHPLEIDRDTYLPTGYTHEHFPMRARYDALIDLFTQHPDTSFVLGLKTRSGEERYNSIIVYKGGAITDIYDKRALLPFAEQNESLHENRLTPAITPGARGQTFSVHGRPAHALICSEIAYPHLTRNNNAALTVSVSNEDAFSSPTLAKYNHIMARFRAVETRSYVLRAVKDGTSSIIAPTGDEIAASEGADTEILRGTIRIPK